MEDYLKTGQVSKLLYRSSSTIRRWASEKNKFPNQRHSQGGHLLIPPYNLIPLLPPRSNSHCATMIGPLPVPSNVKILEHTHDIQRLRNTILQGQYKGNMVLCEATFSPIVEKLKWWAALVRVGVWNDGWQWYMAESERALFKEQKHYAWLTVTGDWVQEGRKV